MFEIIKEALLKVWAFLKRICLKLVSFVKNILSYFRDEKRLEKLKADSDLLAVSIKEKLSTGDYQVVNCLFNQVTSVVEEEDAVVIAAEEVDEETKLHFGDKDMVVIK